MSFTYDTLNCQCYAQACSDNKFLLIFDMKIGLMKEAAYG